MKKYKQYNYLYNLMYTEIILSNLSYSNIYIDTNTWEKLGSGTDKFHLESGVYKLILKGKKFETI